MTTRAAKRHALRHGYDVIRTLVAREQTSRYKNTAMGLVWAVLSPILFLLIFYFVFKAVLSIRVEHYASHVFIGIVMWMWLQASLMEAVGTIAGNAALVSQPGFPVAALPVATVLSNFITFLLMLPILLIIIWTETGSLRPTALFLPALILIQFVLILGLAYFLAAANVVFRDIQYILPLVLQLGYFTTPIFYDFSVLPENVQAILVANPFVHLLGAYRAILIDGTWPQWPPLLLIAALSVAFLVFAQARFRRARHTFLEDI